MLVSTATEKMLTRRLDDEETMLKAFDVSVARLLAADFNASEVLQVDRRLACKG